MTIPHVIVQNLVQTIADVVDSEHVHVVLTVESKFAGQIPADGHRLWHLVATVNV